MKKLIVSLAATTLLLVALPMAVFAHGHGSSFRGDDYSICTVDSCNLASIHKHENTYYAGHHLNDGHEYHEVCSMQGCTKTAAHNHGGNTYFGHHNEDGHSYHDNGRHSRGHQGGGRHH